MIRKVQANDVGSPLMVGFQFPGFETSWAGPCPWTGGFCLGSEDGSLLFSTQGGETQLGPMKTNPSHEAINGVGFLEDSFAVSTRADIAFVTPRPKYGNGFRSEVSQGAHSVISTCSGYFVAPLGRAGLLLMKPEAGGQQTLAVCGSSGDSYFYRVISISVRDSELLVCAMRTGGVAALPLLANGDQRPISSITFPGLDVVDVCPLGEKLQSPAVAAIGKNSTLILFRDAFPERNPITLSFDGIEGTAYRILCDRGHLFILTSTALHVLAGLGKRFLDGEDVTRQPTPMRKLPLEAVDANLAGGWLLVVMPDRVLRIDLEQLVGQPPDVDSFEDQGEVSPTHLTPAWKSAQEEALLTGVG